MERFLIHRIQITSRGQRELFQIRIPRTTKAITGLKVTTNLEVDDNELEHAGSLWLSLPAVREAFYSEAVKAHIAMHDWAGYVGLMPYNFNDGQYWTSGGKETFLSVNVPAYQTLIDGYYASESNYLLDYTVFIYLRLEI